MIINIFITLQAIALLFLFSGLIPIGNRKNWLPVILSFVLFIFLAFVSADIETEHCDYTMTNSTITGNTTSYSYQNNCGLTSRTNTLLVSK